MAYCKRCQCGNVIIFEQLGGSPLRCPQCHRTIFSLKEEIYREPDSEEAEVPEEEPQQPEPAAPEAPEQAAQPQVSIPEDTQPETPEPPVRKSFLITLEAVDGGIVIPIREKTVVGRDAAGKEYLGKYPDVSRKHFTIAPRANGITATLTDHSTYGTYVNGTRMMKESSVVVSNFSEIRLSSRAILLIRVKEVEEYD